MHAIKGFERFASWGLAILLTVVSLGLLALTPWAWIAVAFFGAFALLGLYDFRQPAHAITRNYPVIGHMRFLFEGIRPDVPVWHGWKGGLRPVVILQLQRLPHQAGMTDCALAIRGKWLAAVFAGGFTG